MNRVLLLITILLLLVTLHAQITIISENWEQGTEGWTIANGGLTNQWHRGTATCAPGGGSYSMYVSNNGGTSNAYTSITGTNNWVYFYRDVAFPQNAAFINLAFDIKCNGEGYYDYAKVYIMPTTVTPTPLNNTANTSTYIEDNTIDRYQEYYIGTENRYNSGTLPNTTSYHTITLSIATTYAGTTQRLAFAWINDYSVTSDPPAAIDNIHLTYISADAPPPPALIVSPANAATYVGVSTTLNWSPSPNGPQPTGYKVYFGTTNPPTTEHQLGNVTTWTPSPALNHNITYYWQVVPGNGFGDCDTAPVWSFTTIQANTVAMGQGSTLSRNLPFNMGENYSISQTIYYENELADIPSGSEINRIAYHYTSTVRNLNEETQIYIGSTGLTDFTSGTMWISASTHTLFFNGAVTATWPDSWASITQNVSPFVYMGGNIVVTVVRTEGDHYTQHSNSNWYQTQTAGQYRSIYYWGTTAVNIASPPTGTRLDYIPNTMFGYAPPAGNNLYLQPNSINVGGINQNIATTREISFRAIASSPIQISNIVCSTGITTDQTVPFTIQPNTVNPVTFTILATAPSNSWTGTITVTSNADNGPTHPISLSGVVYPENMVVIGSGTGLTEDTVPLYTHYNFSYSQTIYLPSDINRPSGEVIERVQWHYNAGVSHPNQTVSIYMGYTNTNDFTGVGVGNFLPFSGLSLVYNGLFNLTDTVDPIEGVGNWVDVVLQVPFIYNSSQNLVIALIDNDNDPSWTSVAGFYHMATPTYRSIRSYNDSTQYDPANNVINTNITRFQSVPKLRMFFGEPITTSFISTSPGSLTYVYATLNTPSSRSVTISNLGAVALTVSNIALPANMTSTFNTSLTVAPDTSEEVVFTLSLPASGPYSGNIVITSDAPNDPTITIPTSAYGVPENYTILSGGTSAPTYRLPFTTGDKYGISQSIYLASEIQRPSGDVIESIRYHYNAYSSFTEEVTVYMGYTAQTTFSGTTLIPFSSLTPVYTGPFAASQAVDPVIGGSWVNLILDTPFIYNADQNLVIGFVENDNHTDGWPGSNHQFYTMSTTGVRSLHSYRDSAPYNVTNLADATINSVSAVPDVCMVFGPPIQGPYISVSPRSLSYGNVNESTPATLSATIANIGTEAVTVSSITLPNYMICNPSTPFTVPVGEDVSVNFILTALVQGTYSGTIVINSDAVNSPTVSIVATATVLPEHLVQIGDGTLTGQHIPIYPWYRFTYSQSLYTPADLSSLEDGSEITHVAWQYNGNQAWTQNVRIYMGHTTQTTFTQALTSFVPADQLTLVYQGPLSVTTTVGWTTLLPLTENITYDASRVLVVAVNEIQDGDLQSSGAHFYCTAKQGSQSIVLYHDSPNTTPYDINNLIQHSQFEVKTNVPNISFSFEPAGLPRPRALTGEANIGSISLSWEAPNRSPEEDGNHPIALATSSGRQDRTGVEVKRPGTSTTATERTEPTATRHGHTRTFMGYNVYRNGFEIASALSTTEYIDLEVSGGVTYTYYVTAVYTEGESAPSNNVSVTAMGITVTTEPPVNLVATGNSGSVQLNWLPGTTVMKESFEGGITSIWAQADVDNDELGWLHSTTGGIDGNGYVYSSSLDSEGNLLTNMNFLISPIITITSEDTWLNYWIGSYSAEACNERYWLSIASPPSLDPSGFIQIFLETLDTHEWQRRSFNLSEYVGMPVRIAFVHTAAGNLSSNRNRIKLDGVEIVRPNTTDIGLPLSYNIYVDTLPVMTSWEAPPFTLTESHLSVGRHEVWVRSVYDNLGDLLSSPSNVVVINYVQSDADGDEVVIPQTTKLTGNYPNPFNPTTTIAFDLARTGHVTLDIYNIKGQKVRSLANNVMEAGQHTVVWNGADDAGHSVSSGVYFYRMTTVGHSQMKKMLLLK